MKFFNRYESVGYAERVALRNGFFHHATARVVPRSMIFYDAKKFPAS
ncbi:hypothetical protein BVI2075_330026 [Burkholderia vietnamiensis]|nr:hypothetical protein BVI2075_330026 [Burkholderia vietnamiensis]